MGSKSFSQLSVKIILTLTLAVCLFGSAASLTANSFLEAVLQAIVFAICDPKIQWPLLLAIGFYLTVLIFFVSETALARDQLAGSPVIWKAAFLVIGTLTYAFSYPTGSQFRQPLIFITGATIGQAVMLAVLRNWRIVRFMLNVLVGMLVLASLLRMENGSSFTYNHHLRWSGPWDNPNLFGLLMAAGLLASVGLTADVWRRLFVDGNESASRKYVLAVLYVVAACLMARGLVHSYSRGSWVALFIGFGYFAWHGGREHSWCKTHLFLWFVVLTSSCALVFWRFHQTGWHPAHRAFSTVNAVDFSWKNRVLAWEGALQIAAQHPWFGVGWNLPEPLYGSYYLSPKLIDSSAIQMNDYLTLAATLGIAALFCFTMYLWGSLAKRPEAGSRWLEVGERRSEIRTQMSQLWWLQTTSHASAIALVVGFWFDGGLFKLATASTFWILLELGNAETRISTNQNRTI